MSDSEPSGQEEEVHEQPQKKFKQQHRGAPESEVWAHVERFRNEKGLKAWRCNYCKVERTGAPDRVEHHLATKCRNVSTISWATGWLAYGLTCGLHPQAPAEVRQQYTALRSEKQSAKAKGASAAAARQHASSVTAQGGDDPRSTSQEKAGGTSSQSLAGGGSGTLHQFMKPAASTAVPTKIDDHFKPRTSDKDEVDDALAETYIENGWSFRGVESKSFKRFVEALRRAPKSYRLPNQRILGGRLLDRAYERAVAHTMSGVEKAAQTGGTLVTDGATVRKKPMLNYLFVTTQGAFYMGTEDVSEDLAAGARKDADFIFEGIDAMIQKIGPENIVTIITDGASACQGAWKRIESKYPFIFCLWCGAHVLNLFLKDVGRINGEEGMEVETDGDESDDGDAEDEWDKSLACVAGLVRKAKILNSHFNGREKARALLQVESKKHLGHELGVILPADTRFGLFFIAVARLCILQLPLKSVIHSAVYREQRYDDAEAVVAIVDDDDFWTEAEQLVDFLWPAMGLLRVADSQQPVSGRLYQLCKDVHEGMAYRIRIQEAPSYGDQILAAFKKRSQDLVKDFHKAARVLNPEYDTDGRESDNSLLPALLSVLRRMMNDEDPEVVDDRIATILTELRTFGQRGGLFSDAAIRKAAQKLKPHEWWQEYGGVECPTLQPFAIRLLAQVVGSGDAERNWKTWNFIKSNKQTRLGSGKGDKLVHSHCSFRMINKENDERSYTRQMKQWWEMNEKLGIAGGQHVARKRAFKAFIESWEKSLIAFKPQNLEAERRLSKKYKGVYILDTEREDYQGEVIGVEHVKAGRGYAAGWRVTVAKVAKKADGTWGQEEDDPDTYEINAALIQMIAESPLNGFLALVGNTGGASTSGAEESKDSGLPGSSAEAEVGADEVGGDSS
jgi:hypothetical protein